MTGTLRKGLPEVWPSSIVGLMAGSVSCGFAPWVKAHYQKYDKTPSDFDFAKWRVEHTALLDKTVATLKRDGWTCSVEDQNRFRLTGKTSVLVGKPDIVARKGARVKVLDCKSGQQKDEHTIQVAIYMLALPLAWERSGLIIDGEVVYRDQSIDVDPAQAEHFREPFFAAMRRLASESPEPTVPSEKDCRFCEIAACEARFNGKPVAVTTDLF